MRARAKVARQKWARHGRRRARRHARRESARAQSRAVTSVGRHLSLFPGSTPWTVAQAVPAPPSPVPVRDVLLLKVSFPCRSSLVLLVLVLPPLCSALSPPRSFRAVLAAAVFPFFFSPPLAGFAVPRAACGSRTGSSTCACFLCLKRRPRTELPSSSSCGRLARQAPRTGQ